MKNKAAQEMAQKRWAKVKKKDRKEHMTKMANARWDKVRASNTESSVKVNEK